MSADQRHPFAVETGARAGQKLEQRLLDLGGGARRHDRGRQRMTRHAAHREDVAQRMVGGDLAEHIRIVDEGAKKIDSLHQMAALTRCNHRRIVGRVEADDHIVAARRRKPRQRARQRSGADLRRAAAAAHASISPAGEAAPPLALRMRAIMRSTSWYIRIQRRSIQSFSVHSQAPSALKPPREATA